MAERLEDGVTFIPFGTQHEPRETLTTWRWQAGSDGIAHALDPRAARRRCDGRLMRGEPGAEVTRCARCLRLLPPGEDAA